MTAILIASIEGNVIGVIIFAAVALINWLAQSKAEKTKKQSRERETEESPGPRSATSSAQPDPDEQRLRKFLDALGIPQEQAPPPPPRPRTPPARVNPPPLPKMRSDRPAARLSRPTPAAPQPPRRVESVPAFVPPPSPIVADAMDSITVTDDLVNDEAAAFSDVHLHADSDAPRRDQPSRAARLLSSSAELRKAVILREILGVPRGLQSLDSIV